MKLAIGLLVIVSVVGARCYGATQGYTDAGANAYTYHC